MKSALASKNAELNPGRAERQEPGDGRRGSGDGARLPGTGGGLFGLSGAERQAVLSGWLLGLAIVLLVIAFGIGTCYLSLISMLLR